jgi:hypothetical protein
VKDRRGDDGTSDSDNESRSILANGVEARRQATCEFLMKPVGRIETRTTSATACIGCRKNPEGCQNPSGSQLLGSLPRIEYLGPTPSGVKTPVQPNPSFDALQDGPLAA